MANPERQPYIVNYSSVLLVYFIGMIIPFIILMLIGRFYQIEEFGRYAIATSFMGAAAILFNLGVSTTVSFEIAVIDKQDKKKVAEKLNTGLLCFGVFSLVGLVIIAAALLLLDYRAEILEIIFALLPGYLLMGLNTVMNATFLGIKEMKYIVVSSLTVLITISISVTPMIILKAALWTVALTWSLAQVTGTVTIIILIRRKGYLKKSTIWLRGLGHFIRRSLGVGIDNLISRLGNNLTNILLPLYLTEEAIGVFNGAFKPFILLVAGTQISIQFFNPYVAAVKNAGKKRIEDLLSIFHKIIFFLTFTVTILPLFFAGTLTRLIFGSQLNQSIPYMVILSIGYLVANSPPYSAPLKALDLEWKVALSAVVKLAVNLVGVVILVPILGLMGAVYAVVISLVGYWLANVVIYAIERLKPLNGWGNYLLFFLFALLNSWALSRLLGDIVPAMLIFILLNCSAGLFLYLKRSDRDRLIRLILKPRMKADFSS